MEISKMHGSETCKEFGMEIHLPGVKKFDEEMYKWEELEKTKVLLTGYYKNRQFVIGKNKFCEPVVYVEVLKDDVGYENGYGDDYFGDAYWLPKEERGDRKFTGWDHGHAGDYSPRDEFVHHLDTSEDYKWPLVEMLMEVAYYVAYLEHENECRECYVIHKGTDE